MAFIDNSRIKFVENEFGSKGYYSKNPLSNISTFISAVSQINKFRVIKWLMNLEKIWMYINTHSIDIKDPAVYTMIDLIYPGSECLKDEYEGDDIITDWFKIMKKYYQLSNDSKNFLWTKRLFSWFSKFRSSNGTIDRMPSEILENFFNPEYN